MQKRRLRSSDLEVSAMGLGCSGDPAEMGKADSALARQIGTADDQALLLDELKHPARANG